MIIDEYAWKNERLIIHVSSYLRVYRLLAHICLNGI